MWNFPSGSATSVFSTCSSKVYVTYTPMLRPGDEPDGALTTVCVVNVADFSSGRTVRAAPPGMVVEVVDVDDVDDVELVELVELVVVVVPVSASPSAVDSTPLETTAVPPTPITSVIGARCVEIQSPASSPRSLGDGISRIGAHSS